MTRWVLVTLLLGAMTSPLGAGEIVLIGGQRIEGELANEILMVSTGDSLIEIAAEQVAMLSPGEIRLKDGRVVRGSLVGGQVKARTPLGELSIRVEELRQFSVESPRSSTPASSTASVREVGSATAPPAGPVTTDPSPPAPSQPQPAAAGPRPIRWLEIVGSDAVLHRDAMSGARAVGRVASGQRVRFVDFIDRRLRVGNVLVFDGGHWIKVRSTSGLEGWVPAAAVRELP